MREVMEMDGEKFVRRIKKDETNGRPASGTAFGFVLERSWSFIFDCARPPAAGPQCLDEDVNGG
jgi:hypothetical protein